MNLLDFALVTLYALGLRQLLFEYKKTRFIRDFLLNTPLAELTKCVYCQSIECVVVVLLTRQYIEPVFIVLAIGFVAIALDAWIYQAIANMEGIRSFEITHEIETRIKTMKAYKTYIYKIAIDGRSHLISSHTSLLEAKESFDLVQCDSGESKQVLQVFVSDDNEITVSLSPSFTDCHL